MAGSGRGTIRVHLLGPFEVEGPHGRVAFPTAKVRALAAYLFWKREHWARRELLRGMLWGDLDEERSSANLRTALYLLRRSLAAAGTPDLLQVRRDAVRVAGPGYTVDAALFEEAAWAGLRKEPPSVDQLVTAAGLYRGDFLEDLDCEWCLTERRRLADLHAAVLRTLVDRLASLNLIEAATSYATRWLEVDPLDETAHRAMMRLYAATGQVDRVLDQYRQCRDVLAQELGIAPAQATARLLAELVPAGADALPGVEGPAGCTATPGPAHGRAQAPGQPRGAGDRARARERGAGRPSGGPGASGSDRCSTRRKGSVFLPQGKLSRNPLRNARLLLLTGEEMALLGETEQGIRSLERALALYERFGGVVAKARLLLGETLMWLSIPLTPSADSALRERGLRQVSEALRYFRDSGAPAELVRALQSAAQACWAVGSNAEASALAEEGLALAESLGDREAAARLAAVLGMCLREQHRLAGAVAAFDRALGNVPYLTTPWEILWVLFQRGILSYIIGDLAEAERFLGEAMALCRVNTYPSLMFRVGECMTRSMMIVVLHYRDRPEEMSRFLDPPMGRYNPEPFTYLNELFASGENRLSLLPGVEGWLRARLFRLPSPMVACTIRSVVEEMLAAGLLREAARWAGAAVRLARVRGWGGFEALFLCQRAVALAKVGRKAAAAVCRRRAARLAEPEDHWTRAWGTRVDGLLCEDAETARRYLQASKRLFEKIGSRYDARLVEADLLQAGTPCGTGNRSSVQCREP